MYRSASTNRVSDSYYSSSPKVPTAKRALSPGGSHHELPIYELMSEAGKKEKTRAKFAENVVHLIPLVLLLCAFILWFFSNPEVDIRDSSTAAKIEGMGSEGDLDSDGTGHLPVDLGDLDPAKLGDSKTLFSQNRFL